MTELHSFVFLANNKSNKAIRNGNIIALLSSLMDLQTLKPSYMPLGKKINGGWGGS